jgi:hypothetical protein
MKKIKSILLVGIIVICSLFGFAGCEMQNSGSFNKSTASQYLTITGSASGSGTSVKAGLLDAYQYISVKVSFASANSNFVFQNVSIKIRLYAYCSIISIVSGQSTTIKESFSPYIDFSLNLDAGGKGSKSGKIYIGDVYSAKSGENPWFVLISSKPTYSILSINGKCYVA